MAQLLSIELPGGWTKLNGSLKFQNLYIEKANGGVDIQQNWPRALWMLSVSYLREKFEGDFSQIYNFFLNTGAAVAFDVDDVNDNTHSSGGASGIVAQVSDLDGNLRWQLVKRYPFGSGYYERIIYRPKAGIVLGGGASGGTVDYESGEVTGIVSGGTWAGGFRVPMVFATPELGYDIGPDGLVRAFSVQLREDPLI